MMIERFVSAPVLAEDLNLTARRVQQLVREGVIPRAERGKYDRVEATRGYVRYMQQRERAGSKKLDEDARLRGVQADLRTIELQQARGELVHLDDVKEYVSRLVVDLLRSWRALPARVAKDLAGKSDREIRAALKVEVERVVADARARAEKIRDSLLRGR